MPVLQTYRAPTAAVPYRAPVARPTFFRPQPFVRRLPPPPPPPPLPRTIYRDRVVPGPAVTRNYYSTTYVNQGWSPAQRQAFEAGVRQREYERLMREQRLTSEVAAARAQAYAELQARQQAQLQAQQAILNPPAPAATSPGSPGADLGPTQDQADSDSADAAPATDSGKPHHMLLFVGLAAGAAVIGYAVFHKKSKKRSSSDE